MNAIVDLEIPESCILSYALNADMGRVNTRRVRRHIRRLAKIQARTPNVPKEIREWMRRRVRYMERHYT